MAISAEDGKVKFGGFDNISGDSLVFPLGFSLDQQFASHYFSHEPKSKGKVEKRFVWGSSFDGAVVSDLYWIQNNLDFGMTMSRTTMSTMHEVVIPGYGISTSYSLLSVVVVNLTTTLSKGVASKGDGVQRGV